MSRGSHTRCVAVQQAAESETIELAFEWESLNEPVPDEVFWYKDFPDLPKNTRVYDHRKPEGEQLIEVIGVPPAPAPVAIVPAPSRSTRAWVIGLNLAMFLLVVAVFAWRARRRRTPQQ